MGVRRTRIKVNNISNKNFVKVGVIGCGYSAKSYKLASKVIKNIKIVAASDLKLNRAIRIAGKNHAYTDAEEMYENEDFDVVYIATPHHLHKPMIKQAFEKEKHVHCEKPVAHSIEDAREICKLDKNYKDLKLGFNYMHRYDHKCYRMASAIQNDHLGEVYYANCNIFFSRDETYFDKAPWRAKKESAGGGTLITQGSHTIDIMLWALGEPKFVIGKVDTVKFKNIEVEDVGFGIVEFENGVYAQINNSSFVKPPMSVLKIKTELKIFGEKGRCYYKGVWPFSSLKWKGVKKYKIKKDTKGISHYGRSAKAFGDWVLHDKPYFNTVEESSKALILITALYKSSDSGKKESVEKL
jgi:predicted dehydrogenase